MKPTELIVELQSRGVRVPRDLPGKTGGAGPSEGSVLIINGTYTNVPTQSWFVRSSPYSIQKSGSTLTLMRDGVPECDVFVAPRPRYYDLKTEAGVPLDKIALIHGQNCLASTVYQDCAYRNTDLQCKFCGIGISLATGSTILEKSPEDMGFAAKKARLLDHAEHVTLTTGSYPDEQRGADHLAACIRRIKEEAGLPVHVQVCPPGAMNVLDRLKDAGADTLGVHIETFNSDVLHEYAPCKAHFGRDRYISCWEYAVKVFGKNQVSSFLIAGMGEEPEDIIAGAELLCRIGVYPYLLPLRPVPGTAMEKWKPPDPQLMTVLYKELSSLLKKHGLSSQKCRAGCVRCGACSALHLFEDYV